MLTETYLKTHPAPGPLFTHIRVAGDTMADAWSRLIEVRAWQAVTWLAAPGYALSEDELRDTLLAMIASAVRAVDGKRLAETITDPDLLDCINKATAFRSGACTREDMNAAYQKTANTTEGPPWGSLVARSAASPSLLLRSCFCRAVKCLTAWAMGGLPEETYMPDAAKPLYDVYYTVWSSLNNPFQAEEG